MSTSLARNAHIHRFVKFCIVGASSVVIQFCVMKAVIALLHSPAHWVAPMATAIGALPAIVNGFYWNRRWTFQQGHTDNAAQQFRLFFAVNLVGIVLNYGLMYLFNERLGLFHNLSHGQSLNFILTVGCVTFWNFFANSKWTFTAA